MRSIVVAVLVGIIAKLMFRELSASYIMTLIVFVAGLNFLLEKLEMDNATKRMVAKIARLVAGILAFVGIRLAFGFLFNMPVVMVYGQATGSIFGFSLPTVPTEEMAQAVILELFFLLPGMGIAYSLVYGGAKARKGIYLLSCLAFVAVLWAVKQQESANAFGYKLQSKIDVHTTNDLRESKVDKIKADQRWAIVKTATKRAYVGIYDKRTGLKNVEKTVATKKEIPEGTLVKLTDLPAMSFKGQALINVIFADEDGSYVDQAVTEKTTWLEGECLLMDCPIEVISDKAAIAKQDKTWRVFFYTDEVVCLSDNFDPHQRFMILDARQGEVKCPGVKGIQMFDSPIGKEMEVYGNYGLNFQYAKGKSFTLRFL
ncbi:MAG: hypothetical protein WCP18_01005 [bacterium]